MYQYKLLYVLAGEISLPEYMKTNPPISINCLKKSSKPARPLLGSDDVYRMLMTKQDLLETQGTKKNL